MAKTKVERSRAIQESQAHSVLHALKVDLLKAVASRLGVGKPDGGQKKEDWINHILTSGRSLSDVKDCAYQIECASPEKHAWVGSFRGDFRVPARTRIFNRSVVPRTEELSLTWWTETDYGLALTLEHEVVSLEYTELPSGDLRPVRQKLRHAIFVRVYRESKLLIISYHGFSQGRISRDERLAYSEVVSDVLNALGELLAVAIQGLPFLSTLKFLIEHKSERIKLIDYSPEFSNGRISLSSRNQNTSVSDLLQGFLGSRLNQQSIDEAITASISNSSIASVILAWSEEKVVTRIDFWPSGSEFLFIWGGANPSYELYTKIFLFLRSISVSISDKNSVSILDYLLDLSVGSISKTSDLASRLHCEPKEIRSALLQATSAGWVTPVYRINTSEVLIDAPNEWTEKLASLGKVFTSISGEKIDGNVPRNIEIAFKRMATRGVN